MHVGMVAQGAVSPLDHVHAMCKVQAASIRKMDEALETCGIGARFLITFDEGSRLGLAFRRSYVARNLVSPGSALKSGLADLTRGTQRRADESAA